MTGFKAPLHGRTHLAMGSDPIDGITIGGIVFDKNPQAGTWLYVETTGMDGDGYGMRFVSADTFEVFGGASISFDNAGAGSTMTFDSDDFLFTGADATSTFVVSVNQAVQLLSSGYGDIGIESTELKLITLTTPIRLTAQGGANIEMWASTGSVIVKSVTPGSPVTAIPIFKVTAGTAGSPPTFEITTGATWTATL